MSSSSFGSDSNNVLGLPSRRSLNQLPGNVLGRGAAGVMLLPFYFFRKSRHFFQNRDTSFKNRDTSFKNRDTLSFLFLSLPPRSMLKKKKKKKAPRSTSLIQLRLYLRWLFFPLSFSSIYMPLSIGEKPGHCGVLEKLTGTEGRKPELSSLNKDAWYLLDIDSITHRAIVCL